MHLSLEALRRASLAILKERVSAEHELQDIGAENIEAEELADEIIQIMKVENELYDAYSKALQDSTLHYPSWEDLESDAGITADKK